MSDHEEMLRIFEAQEEELKNIRDIVDYLNDDVLEIKEFGNYYKKDGSYNWKNIDKALAFMRE